MNRQEVKNILEDKIRWQWTSLGPEYHGAGKTEILGIDDAATAIVEKLRQEEQLAILPCGHNAAMAIDGGCAMCSLEHMQDSLTKLKKFVGVYTISVPVGAGNATELATIMLREIKKALK